MIALITAALQGLAAIPEIMKFLINLNIDSRISALERNSQAMQVAFKVLNSAQTTEEKVNAANEIARAWNFPS